MRPNVSVIVPIYNCAQWLDECLLSLKKQTLDNIEIILVDDGSTDSSRMIAEKYVSENKNYSLYCCLHGGASVARNLGLEKATGKYIYFIDGDDYISSNALELLFNKSETLDLDLLKFSAFDFNDNDKKLRWSQYKYHGAYPNVLDGVESIKSFITSNDFCVSCCLTFIRANIIFENNIHFREGIIYEDNIFMLNLLTFSKRIYVMNIPLYYRRYHSNSVMTSPDWMNKIRSMSIVVEEIDKYIYLNPQLKNPSTSAYIISLIKMMFENYEKLDETNQQDSKCSVYFNRVKPVFLKHVSKKDFTLRLFFTNISVYKVYRSMRQKIHKILVR